MAGIGDLVAHLTVDNSQFGKKLNESKRDVSTFSKAVGSTLGSMSGMLVAGAAGLAATLGARASIDAARETLNAEKKLASVLSATGGAAGLSAKEIGEYAGELQKTTNFADDVTVGAAAMLATFQNIEGDNFKQTLSLAQDLSTVMGTDLNSAAMQLGKALNDPAEGLSKLSRAGIQFTDAQQAQIKAMQEAGNIAGAQGIILDAVAGKVGGAAKGMADPWTQFKNTMGDVAENLGFLILPSINAMSEALSGLIGPLTEGQDSFKNFGVEVAVQLAHLGSRLVLWATEWELFFVKIGAQAVHLFTEEFPAYLKHFGEYLFGELTTAWQAVVDTIKGNPIKTTFEMKDFASPERVKGDLEKSLERDAAAIAADLAQSQQTMRDKLLAQLNPSDKARGLLTPGDELDGAATTGGGKFASNGATLALKGSVDAIRSITQQANRASDPQKQLVKQNDKQLAEMKKQTSLLEKLDRPAAVGMALV